MVEQARVEICHAFKLNIDQEIVLNEVSWWFLPKDGDKPEDDKEDKDKTENDESLIDGLSDDSVEAEVKTTAL